MKKEMSIPIPLGGNMNCSHISREDSLALDKGRVYQQEKFKPKGLWYQVNDSWEEWCSYEMPHWLQDRYKYKLIFDTSDMLLIHNDERFEWFSSNYRRNYDGFSSARYNSYIDWEGLSLKYKGIEISPYFYKYRMDPKCNWYYPWDVASGCIWDCSVITKIEKVELNQQCHERAIEAIKAEEEYYGNFRI